ncbi:hypothetical protein [Cetobacterium sp.]|uniref:hypothetical protein n=1 Tax=Cetobacterium sp. TaxID=2071632 RepID=UPI003F34299D
MKEHFYDGRFKVKKLNYKRILKDFKIYKVNLDIVVLKKESNFKDYSIFFKKIRNIKGLKSFYISKELYILGDVNLDINNLEFIEFFVIGEAYEIDELESLEKIDSLILLNLIIRYLAYEDILKIEKDIKYIDINSIYFFINKLSKDKIYKFLKCSFEKSNIFEEYTLNLDQKTFAHESLFYDKSKLKRAIKIGYDSATKLLLPNEDGKYYERNPYSKTIETNFLVKTPNDLTKLRSYYFTLLKDLLEHNLSKYIKIELITLNNYEYFENKSNKSYFEKNLKNISKNVDLYLIKDRLKSGEDITAKDREKEISELINSLKFGKYILKNKGIGEITTSYNKENWNIFLLNTTDTSKLFYDGYKEIKKRCGLISNGFNLDEALKSNNKDEKIVIKRVIEELFIKEQLQNNDISKLHSRYDIFEGVSCIHLKNEKIRKITVLKDGKIKSESCEIFEKCNLKDEFNTLIEKFNIAIEYDRSKVKWMDIKFMKIGKKDIYILDTKLRLYFDSNQFINFYQQSIERGLKGISKSLDSFLGMTMAIRLNKKEQMYYSFYDTGIKLNESFSPNIKKLITYKKLTEKEYEIFCESLVFRYISNGQRLSTYPFFFKLTSEV